jgi:hypothetical protein
MQHDVTFNSETNKWQINGEGEFCSKGLALAHIDGVKRRNPGVAHCVRIFKKDGSLQLEVNKMRGSKRNVAEPTGALLYGQHANNVRKVQEMLDAMDRAA